MHQNVLDKDYGSTCKAARGVILKAATYPNPRGILFSFNVLRITGADPKLAEILLYDSVLEDS